MSNARGLLSQLKGISAVLSSHYVGRVTRLMVVNLPRLLTWAGDVLRSMMNERQQQKMQLVGSKKDLMAIFGGFQLEKNYGGLAENVTPGLL